MDTGTNKMTRAPQTMTKYEKRALQLMNRFNIDRPLLPNRSIQKEFCDWLITIKIPTWKKSTWKYNKYSLLYFLEGKVSNCRDFYIAIKNIGYENCKKQNARTPYSQRNTSAKKAKSVSDKQLEKLWEQGPILAANSYWSRIGLDVFKTIYHVGMRPIEFGSAYMSDELLPNGDTRPYLEIVNAKNTNGRTHGPSRCIYLNNYPKTIIDEIHQTILLCQSPKDGQGNSLPFDQFMRRCSEGFSRLTKKLFPTMHKRIVLYTARHLFAANLKFMGYQPVHIATIMGHGVDTTAFRHYARATSGRSAYRPIHSEQESQQVRQKYKAFHGMQHVKHKAHAQQTMRH